MSASAERLSGVDRAWLLMERPTNPMVVVGLIVLAAPVARARVRELIAERFASIERFRCVPVADPLGACWSPSADFDVEDHLASAALPGEAGQSELEALVGELASTPFNRGRPLWSFHLVERYGRGSALIVRIHHCYADGIALVRVLLSLADGPGAGMDVAVTRPPSADAEAGSGLGLEWLGPLVRGSADLIGKGLHYARHPLAASAAARQAFGLANELTQLALLADDPPTCLKRPLSGVRRVAWGKPLSLEEVSTIGRVLGCTVNDVLVSTLAGALAAYLEAQGEAVGGLRLRAAVPVNLRSAQEPAGALGNHFGLVFVELPLGIRHPLERLYAVRTAMQSLKNSPQALLTLGLLALVGQLGPAVEEPAIALFSAKASLVASNLPGPRQPLRIAGAEASEILFWVPQTGSIGTGVSMLSYNGRVQCGVISDRQMIEHPTELVGALATEFERLVLLVLLGAGSVIG